jgi:ureidoglycolate hydrolase
LKEIVRIKIETLTSEAFRAFGLVVGPDLGQASAPMSGESRGWEIDFVTDGTPRVQVTRAPFQGLSFSKMERHLSHTKVAIPLSGSPTAIVVAPPTAVSPPVPPDPRTVRAFLLDGTSGYLLFKGVWHSIDRFPLFPPGATFVVFNDHETAADLRLAAEGRGGMLLTHQIDFAIDSGVSFELAL